MQQSSLGLPEVYPVKRIQGQMDYQEVWEKWSQDLSLLMQTACRLNVIFMTDEGHKAQGGFMAIIHSKVMTGFISKTIMP